MGSIEMKYVLTTLNLILIFSSLSFVLFLKLYREYFGNENRHGENVKEENVLDVTDYFSKEIVEKNLVKINFSGIEEESFVQKRRYFKKRFSKMISSFSMMNLFQQEKKKKYIAL